MYQLYYYPLNASMAPHLVLEELGADFELILVDRKSKAQKSKHYLALNPAGRIPTLVDNGFAVFESAAICLYLCDNDPESRLLPAIGDPSRALCYQWLMYLSNTAQTTLMLYLYPEKHTSGVDSTACVMRSAEQSLAEIFALLDEAMEKRNYLVGDKLSVCDYFLLMLAVWADELDKPPLAYPNLRRHLCNLVQRSAVRRVCKKENYSLARYTA